MSRIVLFTGKGGVGKTTVAAATALRCGALGYRTLVLSTDPDLVLLDEPAAGMTDQEVLRTVELVREINKTKALIVVEHDMQFIRMIATKVTVFNQGAVLIEANVEAIMHKPIVRDVYLGKQAAAA